MGGGVGISVNSKYIVSCEKTMLAMPEARIGLFADVAAFYHLMRMPRGYAMAMALAGVRLNSYELYLIGLSNMHTDFKNF